MLIATREDLLLSETTSLHTDGLEAVFGKINIAGCKTLRIGCVYRQPNNNSELIYELTESIHSAGYDGSTSNLLITGDFNFPNIDWDIKDNENKYGIKPSPQDEYEANETMLDLINQHSFTQLTGKLTRGNNILDLVLPTFPDLVQKNDVQGGMRDHSVIITDLNLKVKPPRKAKRKVYVYRKADNEKR